MLTGLECLVRTTTLADGRIIRLFRDHVGRYRIVAFKSAAHNVGYSGVLLHPDGEIYYKRTCQAMRGQNTTRQLQALLGVWGVKWFSSQYLTDAGKACYSDSRGTQTTQPQQVT